MKRHTISPRPDWQKKVENIGFGFHTLDTTYWDESVFYELSMKEVDTLEKATDDLWKICLDAVQHVMDENLYSKFQIPDWFTHT